MGAVVVRNETVVGRGFHTWAGVKHAEVFALEQAGERAHGATLYISLEPCSHQGRTPPCIDAILAAGIRKVVAPMEDPNPQVRGRGFASLREAGVEVEIDGSCAQRAVEMNQAFVHFARTGLPLVTLKAALTLDGRIAGPEDGVPGFTPSWITSETARAHVQILRHNSDAILTGIGTVLADDCLLTDRSGKERSRPLLRMVLDSQLRLPPESRLAESCRGDVLVVTTSAASAERRARLEAKGVRVEVLEGADGRASLRATTELLASERYLSLMIEAGSRVNWSALESGVADKIFFYYAPKILGGTQSLPVAGGRAVAAARMPSVFTMSKCIRSQSMSSQWRRGWRKMFTGIVEELGTVGEIVRRAAGARLRVKCAIILDDLREGASISVNGVCLTALGLTPDSFDADLAPETLARSNLGDLLSGSRVNLERPVTPATRLSGHIVLGHVDATGELISLNPLGDGNWWLKVRVPPELDRYLVHKGSIAIDGISLTVASLDSGPTVGVTIIPHTYANTTLRSVRPGGRLNLEVDVLAKHIEKLMKKMSQLIEI